MNILWRGDGVENTDIVSWYTNGKSIRSIATRAEVSTSVVRRILISEGVELRDCPRAQEILRALKSGASVEEVAKHFGILPKTVREYVPYTKGSYSVGEKSANAICIQRHRERSRNK